MPYTPKQNRLFWAAASDPKVAKEVGISQRKAKEMAKEGVKKPSKPAKSRKSK